MDSVTETQTWSGETFGDGALGFCLSFFARFGQKATARNRTHVMSADVDVEAVDSVGFEDASAALSADIEGVRALMIVSLDGHIEDQVILDETVGPEALSEFATLVRIACRTSQDAGSGGLVETTWASEGGTVLSRHVDEERFLVLIGGPTLRTSFARYVLRQAARRMKGPDARR